MLLAVGLRSPRGPDAPEPQTPAGGFHGRAEAVSVREVRPQSPAGPVSVILERRRRKLEPATLGRRIPLNARGFFGLLLPGADALRMRLLAKAGFSLTLCMNALGAHFAIPTSGTVEVLPFSPLLPSPPVPPCGTEYKRLEETPRGGAGGVRRRESAPARNLHNLSFRPGL